MRIVTSIQAEKERVELHTNDGYIRIKFADLPGVIDALSDDLTTINRMSIETFDSEQLKKPGPN